MCEEVNKTLFLGWQCQICNHKAIELTSVKTEQLGSLFFHLLQIHLRKIPHIVFSLFPTLGIYLGGTTSRQAAGVCDSYGSYLVYAPSFTNFTKIFLSPLLVHFPCTQQCSPSSCSSSTFSCCSPRSAPAAWPDGPDGYHCCRGCCWICGGPCGWQCSYWGIQWW